MSPGQTGHITGQMGCVPGTDGTHTRGCPAKILYVYWFFLSPLRRLNWEVLSGVGVDGVGGIFPFFLLFFFVFLRFSSLFFVFLRFLPILLEQGQTTAIYWENGEFHSDPVCTDPVRNFPIKLNNSTLVYKPAGRQFMKPPLCAMHQVFALSIKGPS